MGFIHSKLRNYLGRDTAEKLDLVETDYLQFTENAIPDMQTTSKAKIRTMQKRTRASRICHKSCY
jgi:hypothetical protein